MNLVYVLSREKHALTKRIKESLVRSRIAYRSFLELSICTHQ